MFNTDKPITQESEDKLGRNLFVKQLAKAIVEFQTKDNYVISLQGKWGCGKTSILNMTVKEIELLSEKKNKDDKNNTIKIIHFNPWNFTDTNQLISQFFITLTTSLKIGDKNKTIKKVGEIIENYSAALNLPKPISAVGKLLKGMVKSNLEDISYKKSKVEEALTELECRILIVIDDIDRLTNEQIKIVFQLVNNIAGFPNITYLLSFDRDIVANALRDVQGCNGQEYLEKIIQIPFDVPPVNISKLHNVLFDKINELIQSFAFMEFDENRWRRVFEHAISPFIKHIRDVNRFYNVLLFKYPPLHEEVSFIDIAAITALQVFEPKTFEWIRENKYSLVKENNKNAFGGNRLVEEKAEKGKIIQELKVIYPTNFDIIENAVAVLFPTFMINANLSSYKSLYPGMFLSNNEMYPEMRIESRERFDLYFSLSIDDIKIRRKDVDDSIHYMDEMELREYTNFLSEHNLLNEYLKEIENKFLSIPEERYGLFLALFAFQGGKLLENKSKTITAKPNTDITYIRDYTITDLLVRIDGEELRYDVISKMFVNADFLSFQFLLPILHRIELEHGRVAEDSGRAKEILTNLDYVYELEKIFMKRTKEFAAQIGLFDWKMSQTAAILWNSIEEDSYVNYTKKELQQDIAVPKFIAISVNEWSDSSSSRGYKFEENFYTKFLDDETIANTINKLRYSDVFWEMDKRIIEISAAFTLKPKGVQLKPRIDSNKIGIDSINHLIDEWTKDFTARENK